MWHFLAYWHWPDWIGWTEDPAYYHMQTNQCSICKRKYSRTY